MAKKANKEAKNAVARAKASAVSKIYDGLETRKGVKKIYSLAKRRNKAAKDLTQITQIKSETGEILSNEQEIKARWKIYFERLLKEENGRRIFGEGTANERETLGIARDEVVVALKGMKNGKATGPDEIPAEVWKALGEEGVDLLWDLLKKVYDQEKMPDAWRDSVIVPIYEEKGDIQDYGNYRGIRVMSHTMKIWERIIERRVQAETEIEEQQFGFMPGKGTTDAIFLVRQLMEKYGEKQRRLHFAIVDLEKAYDRVPLDETWRCLREAGVSEKYVGLIQDMYEGARTLVRTSVGESEMFPVTVGLHQGSSLSPYIFDIIMEELGIGIIEPAPWDLLFADNIVKISNTREGLQQKIERWRRVLEDRGLKISRKKTEYTVFNGGDESGDVCLLQEKLKKINTF